MARYEQMDYRFTHTGSLEDQINLTGLHNLRKAGAVNDGQPDLSKVIIAGKDRRGYRFFGVCMPDGVVRVIAGCRCLTLLAARCHWTQDYRGHADDHTEEIAALLDVIEHQARARGWRIRLDTQGRGYFDSRGATPLPMTGTYEGGAKRDPT